VNIEVKLIQRFHLKITLAVDLADVDQFGHGTS
jgi:hypothetical protein